MSSFLSILIGCCIYLCAILGTSKIITNWHLTRVGWSVVVVGQPSSKSIIEVTGFLWLCRILSDFVYQSHLFIFSIQSTENQLKMRIIYSCQTCVYKRYCILTRSTISVHPRDRSTGRQAFQTNPLNSLKRHNKRQLLASVNLCNEILPDFVFLLLDISRHCFALILYSKLQSYNHMFVFHLN